MLRYIDPALLSSPVISFLSPSSHSFPSSRCLITRLSFTIFSPLVCFSAYHLRPISTTGALGVLQMAIELLNRFDQGAVEGARNEFQDHVGLLLIPCHTPTICPSRRTR